ncbi:MAG: phosphohydrolase [Clostridiaceae bacterium]|nr:phosphohydrolase [Clostridiaceae bacterium]
MKTLCIYHSNCADGFGSAWVVRKALGADNVEFHPGVHQDAPPDVTGRKVILADFSYKRAALLHLIEQAAFVTIIDHHKTALDELNAVAEEIQDRPKLHGKLLVVFDLNRSGAGLAWDQYFPGQPRPALLDHIEDRDLWRFALPNTRLIQAAVFSYPYDFDVWDGLFDQAERNPRYLASEGMAIERKHFKDIYELVTVMRRPMVIGGVEAPVANLPYTLASDAGHLMATEHPSKIGVCYWDTPGGRVFSLRSTDDGPDVSAIAKLYGGGGHAHAAGFRVAIGWEGDPR